MYLKALSCNVFRREMYACAARSANKVDLEFLPQGLHDVGSAQMSRKIQDAIDTLSGDYDAIVLGYGLCNNGLVGVHAVRFPIVTPRAHDCITLFLGSRERYLREFDNEPGTYFKTPGWFERNDKPDELNQFSIKHQAGMDATYEELVAKYGKDNADYLYETLVDNTRHYKRFAYIATGVEPDDRWEKQTRKDALERGWKFERLSGNLRLIQKLLDGDWDNEFLVVPKGSRIEAVYDESIIRAVPDCDDSTNAERTGGAQELD